MSLSRPVDFLDNLRPLVGVEGLIEAPDNLPNVSGIDRRVQTLVRPAEAGQVRAIVNEARRFHAPLYPVACGKNWGYGSALPVTDGCTLLDLRRMDRIRAVDSTYAIVEPGVTQGQLFEAIDGKGLYFNATGAGADTSVLGNTLERGFGYHGLRADDVLGFEVVLGTGKVLRTGFWGVEGSSAAHCYPSSVGPSLDGLFCQSNFGIVTAVALRLHQKPPVHAAMLIALDKEEDFPRYLDALARLRRSGVFTSIMHIGNSHRARATLGPVMFDVLEDPAEAGARRKVVEDMLDHLPYRAWSGVTAIQGEAAAVDEAFACTRTALEGIAGVERIDEASLSPASGDIPSEEQIASSAKRQLFDLTRGVPVDGALWSPFWALGMDLPEQPAEMDDSHVGILFCAPILPFEGEAASRAVRVLEETLGRFGFEAYITLNIANASSLLCITNIVFDRREVEQVQKGHEAIAAAYRAMIDAGHYPYRLGIQSMDLARECMGESFETARELKRVFDPDGIIAPGRYGLE